MNIGIIGSGTMGEGIAQVAAMAGHRVAVFDKDERARKRCCEMLRKRFTRLVEKNRITNAEGERFLGNVTYAAALE